MEIITAVLTLLVTVLPTLITHWSVKAKERRIDNEALIRRSLDELDIGTGRMPK
jgi:hypothetical protein